MFGDEIWTLREVDQKYVESFGMWCWRRMEKISWTDGERNEVLQAAKEERHGLETIKRRKTNWIGHVLHKNCLLKGVITGNIEGRKEGSDGKKRMTT